MIHFDSKQHVLGYCVFVLFVCFACLFRVYRPTREFLTHMPVKGCKCLPMLALMAIEQWGFFNVPHPLRHGPTVIMVISEDPWHLFGSGTVTSCFYDLSLSRPGIESRSPACEANALPLRHRGGVCFL